MTGADPQPLTAEDLISNRALAENDPDRFGYEAVAGRVAETLLQLDPPLTLGLFGPWGSGKSSMFELLRRELARQGPGARLVPYDASTYGGEALKRNFISHIANELGYKETGYPEFHSGLYESKRKSDLDFEALKGSLWPAAKIFVALYVGFLALSCLIMGAISVSTDEDFLGQIADSLPALIAPTAIASIVVAFANILVKGATLEAEQTRPASDEAFAKTFRRLVERGRDDSKFNRLVVFVDELDRCSADDVVTTLTAIRTFLTQEHCAFIVAADRAALERALEEKLPQPTPIDEENPSYSSASFYFDKIFHDRIPLPPLRGARLYEWAFDQVRSRGGYWGRLRDDGDEAELRKVLYYLIPSHVRAPRRVKVLLNGFVRNAAIAAHSDFDWRGRAREIAKLTVLDTEFPAVGADLRIDPRLPELLMDPPAKPSDRVARLLAKHGAKQVGRGSEDAEASGQDGEATTLRAGDGTEEAEPVDPILAQVTQAEARVLTKAEHELLRRYLARTRDVKIGRDLLFLDRAGAAVGVEDVELGELLDGAVDEPDAVVEALQQRDETETLQLAARVLAGMADQEFGEERINVVTALTGVIDLLGARGETSG